MLHPIPMVMGSSRITALILGTIGILKSSIGISIKFRNFAKLRPSIAIRTTKRPFHCHSHVTFTFNKIGVTFLTSSNRFDLHRRYSAVNLELTSKSYKYVAYVAVGSNLGDRFQNIRKALQLLEADNNVWLTQTSFLYETKPMYVTDQPAFLNGAVELRTNLDPLLLLDSIKKVEAQLGRDFTTIRNGPRPVDLDILTYAEFDSDGKDYKSIVMDTKDLIIPHARIQERDFVLIPFIDIAPQDFVLPKVNLTLAKVLLRLKNGAEPSATRALPLSRARLLYFNETIIMGILNVTPDSFSDGGQWSTSIDDAVKKALSMEKEGAAIIDIGGESTRPGAVETSADEQIRRTIPVIEGIRKVSNVAISIDTRSAEVAMAAIQAGADIVNDVSGGCFDEKMLQTVGQLEVPIILMHMRGTPETMQSLTTYDNVVNDVATTLLNQSNLAAQKHSIHRWQQIVDPGIGFAKDLRGNLLLLQNISVIRSMVRGLPILIGTSRKGFIGKIANVSKADERDPGTIASYVTALCLEYPRTPATSNCNIIRVHNVAQCRQAALVMDAIRSVN